MSTITFEINNDIELMKVAYGQLFHVENALRSYIVFKMENEYGNLWFTKAPQIERMKPPKKRFDQLYIYELELYYLRVFPVFKLISTKGFFNQLHTIYPIRNKIAHSHLLTADQFDTLNEAYDLIIEKLQSA